MSVGVLTRVKLASGATPTFTLPVQEAALMHVF